MADEWRPSTWGAEVSLEYGKAIRGYSQTNGKYRVFGSNGPIGWTSEALAQGPGVILGRKGAYRGTEFCRDPFWVIDTAYYLVPKTDLDMRWLYYAVKHYKLGDVDDGSPIPSTTRAAVYMLDLEVPPIEEQHAIAHILGTLDDKIELNRRRNQTLEAMARALFQDWFVDFGPVRAKMEGREPYLPTDLWRLFPDRLDAGGKPEGWHMTTLASFASLNPESWSKRKAPDSIEYVDLASTKLGTIETTARLLWSEAPSRAQRVLRAGDTIVGTVRPANGSYALVNIEGLTGSTGFAVLRPMRRTFREFVFLAATSTKNIERLSHLADGAAYPAVRPDVVFATQVLKPGQKSVNGLLKGFSSMAGKWIDSIEQSKQEVLDLVQLRDTLLPQLISGEFRITGAEKFMEREGI